MSLDVFRGATIASMMLVNNPGNWNAIYAPLDHAEWNGWTFTDLIFPFFVWIVGVAIPLSTARRLEQGARRDTLFWHVVRRAVILFALGFFLNSLSVLLDSTRWADGFGGWLEFYLHNVRVPGVLQRIAICYLVASTVYLLTEKPEEMNSQSLRKNSGIRWQAGIIALLLVTYWLLMAFVPVPGHGAGDFEKGANLSNYLDSVILNGRLIGTHVWASAKTWDPEGTLSTIPAIATCLFGVLTGQLLRSRLTQESKTAWLFVGGNLLLFVGSVMNFWLPINKNLWTSSYTVFMAGMAMNCFAVCYWLVDVQGRKTWARPFAIYGMNAITVFMLAGILGRISIAVSWKDAEGKTIALKSWLYNHLCGPFATADTSPFLGALATPKNASLLWAIIYVLGLYLVAWFMYRRKWFVRF